MKKFIVKYVKYIAPILGFTSIGALCIDYNWVRIVPIMISALFVYILIAVFVSPVNEADKVLWYPPQTFIDEVLDELFTWLTEHGYAKKDYIPNLNDCDDFAYAGKVAFHDILLPIVKDMFQDEIVQRGIPIYLFSFRRDNGKRHRLFFVVNSTGNRTYIENYPVFDSYHDVTGRIRILSENEEQSGEVIT